MTRNQLRVVAVSLAAAGALAACDVSVGEGGFSFDVASGNARDTCSRSYPLAAGGRLELINVNGRIEAVPATGDTVELKAERSARASTDEAAAELLAGAAVLDLELHSSYVSFSARLVRLIS